MTTGRPYKTGRHPTHEALVMAVLADWGDGPPWKQGVAFTNKIAKDHGVSASTVRRIIDTYGDK